MAAIASLPIESKLKLSVENAAKKLPGELGRELLKLVEPQALAVMVGVLTVWGLAHFVGAGFVADIILLIVGAAALGGLAIQAGQEISGFVSKSMHAKDDKDIDAAGTHLSKAVSIIGIQTVMVILLKKRPSGTFGGQEAIRLRHGPKIPGTWRYKPSIKRTPAVDSELGSTSVWGDIHISSRLPKAERRVTLFHELVHSILSPKLYFLRDLRATIAYNGYAKSHLLRYLEEAMCETYAQLRTYGFSMQGVLDGIYFPIAGRYTTITALQTEASGIFIGTITVGGMIYNVFTGASRP